MLAFGNPGSGKTHLLCAIGHELIQQNYRVLIYTCSLLVQDLLITKRDMKLGKLLKKLSKFDALIIDDMGMSSRAEKKWKCCSPCWQSGMNVEA